MATPAQGTIPALPQYQPGQLRITGSEILEIASSPNATTAVSGQMYLVDFVGKAPSAMAQANPLGTDLVAFFQEATGSSFACPISNLAIPSGNLPVSGNTGQLLAKNSGANFDASWYNLSTFIAAGTSIFLTGSTTVQVGVATAGITGTQVATNAIGNIQLRQGAGLSIVGVAGSATANVADIVASGAAQVLQCSGTNLLFTTIAAGVLPGPFQTTSLPNNQVIVGNGASALKGAGVSTTGLTLIGNGTTNPPSFGVASVIGGGTNTNTLTQYGIPYGNGTNTIGITPFGPTGQALVGNGSSVAPAFAVVGVPGGGTNTSTLTLNGVIFGNGSSTVGVTAFGVTGQPLVANGSASPPAFAVLGAVGGGTGTSFVTQYGIPYGGGSATLGVTAFGGAGTFLQGNGSALAPTFSTVSISSGWGITGASAGTTNGTLSIATTNPPYGFDVPINLTLTAATAAGNLLIVSAVGNNGATASATNPILIPFRDSTIASGDPVWRAVTTTLSISTFSTGATLGAAGSNAPFRIYITAHDTGTAPLLGLICCTQGTSGGASISPLNESILVSSQAIGSTSTGLGTFYTANGSGTVTSRPFRVVGFADYGSGLATAGTYASSPTTLQLSGPGSKKPGDILQTQVYFTTTQYTTTATTAFQNSGVTVSITPTSTPNLVRISSNGAMGLVTGASIGKVQVVRGASAQVGPIVAASAGTTAGLAQTVNYYWVDGPGTASATSYTVQVAPAAGSAVFPTTFQGASGAMIIVEELMA
jgi:hypothetical protein